jgi:hypothetical protein
MWHGGCSTYREEKRYRVLVVKPAGRRPLGRGMLRWQDNIKINLKEISWEAWTGLIWLRAGK